ncbi:hypothetical protein EON67_09810 [archaeon]|nr:MAG: hypothetical protein EON67_09810 [archaeon]
MCVCVFVCVCARARTCAADGLADLCAPFAQRLTLMHVILHKCAPTREAMVTAAASAEGASAYYTTLLTVWSTLQLRAAAEMEQVADMLQYLEAATAAATLDAPHHSDGAASTGMVV